MSSECSSIQCTECPITFIQKKNLYKHLRKKHNIEPELPGKLICSLNCATKFRTHRELRSHLDSFHQQKIENEVHEFPDYETFETWKKRVEASSGCSYTRRQSEKLLSRGDYFKTHFVCHRSGVFRSASKGLRKMKKIGSNKIGRTCPAIMEVSRSKADGIVQVIFWKTHLGHSSDIVRTSQYSAIRQKISADVPFDVCAILPAAGSGERMGLNTPKQYISIHGKPIICYTVEAFLRIHYIKKVVVVAAPENLDLMLQTLSQKCALYGEKLMVTEGAKCRHQSIDSGLKALQTYCDNTPEVVVIHDGVRPFLTEDIVLSVVTAAKEHGAAGIICPLVSTVISADEKGFLDSSLDRNKYKASEMPQAFQYNLICQAYDKCSAYDLENGTECLHLVQKYTSVKAKLVHGSTNLWKVTHHKDIYTATAMVKENQNAGILCRKPFPPFLPFLKLSLNKSFKNVSVVKPCDKNLVLYPNLVIIQSNKSPYDVIEETAIINNGQRITQLTSIVNILYQESDLSLNFIELQKQAKSSAKELEKENILVYYVIWPKSDASETFEEKSQLVTSLLFDSNPHISGTVFLS